MQIISIAEAQNDKIRWGSSVSGPFQALLPFTGFTSPYRLFHSITNISLPAATETGQEVSFMGGEGVPNSFVVAYPSFLVKTAEILAVPDCVSQGRAMLSKGSIDAIRSLYKKVLKRRRPREENGRLNPSGQRATSKTGDARNSVKSVTEEHSSKTDCQTPSAQDAEPDVTGKPRLDPDCDTNPIQTSDTQFCQPGESHDSTCTAL